MPPKRLLLISALILLIYLGGYSWNQRTHFLDTIVTNVGLETSGYVIKSVLFLQDAILDAWKKYVDLVNVREENDNLKKELSKTKRELFLASEERAELDRLRDLLKISPPIGWTIQGTRVLAGRMGSNAALATIVIDRGYLTGAIPGTPVITQDGIVGRVFRAGPTTSTVLLLIDPGSRIAVVSQKNRVQGILVGSGAMSPLEVRFVSRNRSIEPGELLVTSGLDEAFPKGIPVAKISKVTDSDMSPFQTVEATPLVPILNIEELLLLQQPVHHNQNFSSIDDVQQTESVSIVK